jgi:hypothetical protein
MTQCNGSAANAMEGRSRAAEGGPGSVLTYLPWLFTLVAAHRPESEQRLARDRAHLLM